MNELLLGLLTAMLATNQVVAASNVVAQTAGIHVTVVDPSDLVEREYQQLLVKDDEAQTEVDEWIKQAGESAEPGSRPDPVGELTLNARIKQRFEAVEQGYQDFLLRNPRHARARLAYGSLLSDLGRHDEAVAQWERARELEPDNPATWNNLADHFSHFGPARKCIEYFAKAVELNPKEPVYRWNLATAVFAFRVDARDIYKLPNDQAVLRKALEIYRQARARSPDDFKLATDLAQVFYYLAPAPTGDDPAARRAAEAAVLAEGLAAWKDAEKLAANALERQGLAIHMARLCGMHGDYDQARRFLDTVTEPGLADIKARVRRGIEYKEKGATAAVAPDKAATAAVESSPAAK